MKTINTILLGAILVMLIIIQSTLSGMSSRMEAQNVTKIIHNNNGERFIDIVLNGPLTIDKMQKIIDAEAPGNEYTP